MTFPFTHPDTSSGCTVKATSRRLMVVANGIVKVSESEHSAEWCFILLRPFQSACTRSVASTLRYAVTVKAGE
jgi:hypothetical protein